VHCVLVAGPVHIAQAQGTMNARAAADTFGVVIGVARSGETDQPVPLARASIEGRDGDVQARGDGTFRLRGLPTGHYSLLVRQIGFLPSRIGVDVDGAVAAAAPSVVVRLERLPILLGTIRVAAGGACTGSGFTHVGDVSDADVLLQQLAINVDQYRNLARQFPVTRAYVRRRWLVTSRGATIQDRTDTVTHNPAEATSQGYAPGRILERQVDAEGNESYHASLPGFGALGSRSFQDHHCFRYAGTDSANGQRRYRIDFVPTADVTVPDVDGSIYLDAKSFMLRNARFRIVNLPSKGLTFQNVETMVTFREVVPFFVIDDGLEATQRMKNVRTSDGEAVVEGRQSDRLIDVHFIGAKP